MSNSLAIEPRQLEWSGKLCILLLNDGTNALRWFLKENLSRKYQQNPQLDEILKENQFLFSTLCAPPHSVINHEMFDILYQDDGEKFNEADLEIYILFVLIKYLCKIKHWSWKWWDEDPQDHQTAPIFDVIRLFRFKQRMKGIVHHYEITEEKFNASWNYLTAILDRFNSYKISSRRWNQDQIKACVDDQNIADYVPVIKIMQWQTLDLKSREEIYLSLKESWIKRQTQNKINPSEIYWSEFVSNFGQMRARRVSRLERPKSGSIQIENEIDSFCMASSSNISCAQNLNGQFANKFTNMDELASQEVERKSYVREQSRTNDHEKQNNLELIENKIMAEINNDVFIEDKNETFIQSNMASKMLRKSFISRSFYVAPLLLVPNYRIHMDQISFNIEKLPSGNLKSVSKCGDVILSAVDSTLTTNWRKILFSSSSPLRVLIGGERSCGKTTLLKKIAYDWSTKNHIELGEYKLVFFIDLGLVKIRKPYTSLSECIVEQCLKDFSVEQVEDLFNESNGEEILLLLDGVEEMHDIESDAMSEISEIICGKRWPKCSMVVTTNFTKIFSDSQEKSLYKNTFFLHEKSVSVWSRFNILGFTTKDILVNLQRFFEWSQRSSTTARVKSQRFSNFCKVFQRDIYKGIVKSPMMSFLLAHTWLTSIDLNEESRDTSRNYYPETLSGSIKPYIDKLVFSKSDSKFWNKILDRVLRGSFGLPYKIESQQVVSDMMKAGLIEETGEGEDLFRFVFSAFEEYCASKWLLEINQDIDQTLQQHIVHPCDAIRLKNFLLFCCSLNKTASQCITTLLSSLIKRYQNQPGETTLNHFEAIKHILLQCFYEANFIEQKSFLPNTEEYAADDSQRNDKGGSELRLRRADLLSNRSKQAILFLSSQCRPTLNKSGTVFPFTDVSTMWIRSIQLSSLQGEQFVFVAKILRNLPFLEEAKFDDAFNVKDKNILDLCSGFTIDITSSVSKSVLHSFLLTLKINSYFDPCQVTSYKEIGYLLPKLPFLEDLCLSIPNQQLLFSLFETNLSPIVPLTAIDLSKCGFTSQECFRLAPFLKQLIFLENLNLSNNPLGDGMKFVADQFYFLGRLQVLNISGACLSPSSVKAIATNLTWTPRLVSLDLNGNHIQDLHSISQLLLSIKLLPALKYLDLSNNCLGDDGVCMLAKSLDVHQLIENLRLNYVQMGPIGLSALKLHLRKCSKLKEVSLAGNYWSPQLLNFTQLLSTTDSDDSGLTQIQDLDLSGGSCKLPVVIHPNTIEQFLKSIEQHQNLKRISLKNIRIDSSHLAVLLQGCEQHSSLAEICLSKSLLNWSEKEAQIWKCLKLV